jgi:hypothetical protein
MSENKQQFEKLSFWQLLKTRGVEIPIIQRDYAQGRDKQKKVRDTFLNALYPALDNNPIELDFVYGSEKNNVLQPLDGQQRLTTLFLLHWFIAKKEGRLEEEAKKRLSKFTYETRTSSREFCNELINGDIEIKNDEEISTSIKEKTVWFVASWQKDPTISAMLIMLDAIQDKFKDTFDLWDKLTDEQNPPITFLYMKLENFGLSDDLYIKMNARGKQLTAFENFKARFERYIEEDNEEKGKENWEKELKINDDDNADIKKEKLSKQFKNRIDGIWTDLFWKYKEKIKREDDKGKTIVEYKIDNCLLNFIAGIAINYYSQDLEILPNKEDEEKVRKELVEKGKTKNVTNEAVKRERIENRITHLANHPNDIAPEDFPSKNAFDYLVNCLNKYAEKIDDEFPNAELKTEISLWDYCDKLDSTLFKILIQDQPASTYKQRVLFYAQTKYLLNNSFDAEAFSNWMRVVRNIVENSTIDAATTFIGAIGLINELAKGSADIYDYLSKNKIQSGFANEQVKEEIEKAKIIVANPNTKQIIHNTEDTNFCKGKIDFALYCIDYDIDKSPDAANFDAVKLETIKNVLTDHLNDSDVTNDFRRALFTIGDNKFYNYWGSWLYAVSADKRCMIENTDDLKRNFTKKGSCLKELVNKLSSKNINEIIDDFGATQEFFALPNWKQKIITTPNLLDYSHSHYIAIATDESCCWLIPYKKVANNSEGRKKLKKIE